jgi:regulator of protease activity HflC (stomatin/prohibitin superfamily)
MAMLRGSNNIVTWLILGATAAAYAAITLLAKMPEWGLIVLFVGAVTSASPRVINEWERAVLLRLGKYRRVLNPGVWWVIPGIDRVVSLVDMRIRSTSFSAEKTLTKDTVPVDVDAVLFWVVTDAQRAVLEVEQYQPTVSWAAQTTLRDVIGRTELVRMISDRATLDQELQTIIDAKTSEWGSTVQSVEIRDVRIPGALEDAMSRKAQADREREARVILANSELLVAEQMTKAAELYRENKTAMQLRAMNMTYESIKERGALMVIPSGMAESMNPGTLGLAALGFQTGESGKKEGK